MSQSKIKVRTKTQSYNIIIGNNLIKNLSKILKDSSMNFKKCLLVIDKKVPKKNLENIFFFLKRKRTWCALIFKHLDIQVFFNGLLTQACPQVSLGRLKTNERQLATPSQRPM